MIGIGLNLSIRREQLPEELRETATSLAIEAEDQGWAQASPSEVVASAEAPSMGMSGGRRKRWTRRWGAGWTPKGRTS